MITLLLVLKLLQFTKLTPHIYIYFFFTSSWCIYFFCLPFLSIFFKKSFITPFKVFFFLIEKKVEISNYNKCKLLIFIQKIEKSLSTYLSTCSKANYWLCVWKAKECVSVSMPVCIKRPWVISKILTLCCRTRR